MTRFRICGLFWRQCCCGGVLLCLSIGNLKGGEPWADNSPIVRVAKEIYQPIPRPDTTTHEIEVYASPYGTNPKSMYEAPVRQYRLALSPTEPQKNSDAQKSLRTRLMVYHDDRGNEQPVGSPADWQRRRGEILKGMQLAMGELPDRSELPPLDVQVTETVDEPRFQRQTMTFAAGKSNRVPAYLYLPKERPGNERGPAVLALHQTAKIGKREVDGQGKADQRYGRELAERGYVVLAPDYPSFGDFKCDFTDPRFASGTIHGVFNHMRAVDLLESRPEVDRERIGVIGHSLGGHNSVFLGAFDPRVKVIVSSCGWSPFHDDPPKVNDWTGPRYMPRLRDAYGLDPARIPFDFYEIVAALAPRPFLSISPTRDHDFAVAGVRKAIPAAREVYALHGAADKLAERYPDCGHGFPDEERQAAYEFLDRHLQGAVTSK